MQQLQFHAGQAECSGDDEDGEEQRARPAHSP
jgi:hypothetical protein